MGINRDRDTLLDGLDNCADAENDAQTDTDADSQGDACDQDDDGDNLLDDYETNTGIFVSPFNTGTDPLLEDSDGDGYDDGTEVLAGSNPNSALSIPGAELPGLPFWGLVLLGGVLGASAIVRIGPKRP